MSIFLFILAIILVIAGIVGSIVPGLPGPPLSWAGLLVAFFRCRISDSSDKITMACLLIWLAITVVVTIIDYVIPAKFTRLGGGTKAGSNGAMVGMLAGIILTPVGMIAGCLLGALIGELLFGKRGLGVSCRSALGAFAGVMAGTGIKLVATVAMMFYIV